MNEKMTKRTMLRRRMIVFFVMPLVLVSSAGRGGAYTQKNNTAVSFSEFDLVIDAVARQVETISEGSFANAVEPLDNLGRLEEIVSFHVKEVLKSPSSEKEKETQSKRFSLPRFDPNAIVQRLAKNGAKNWFRSNSVNAGRNLKDRWFRIAVKSARESFGIESPVSIEPKVHRIYLKQHGAERSSFVMLKHEVIEGG